MFLVFLDSPVIKHHHELKQHHPGEQRAYPLRVVGLRFGRILSYKLTRLGTIVTAEDEVSVAKKVGKE